MASAKHPARGVSPAGTALRELHERVRAGRRRASGGDQQQNKLSAPQNRWQRNVRYVWDRKKG